MLRDLFRKYSGTATVPHNDAQLTRVSCIYALIQITTSVDDDSSLTRLQPVLSALIRAAILTRADVDQYLGDTLLLTFGVHDRGTNKYDDVAAFVHTLGQLRPPARAVLGEASGMYGAVGTPDRMVVTLFSSTLIASTNFMRSQQKNGIFIQHDLMQKLHMLDRDDISIF